MLTAGIIAEYNPFHFGHALLIRRLRQLGATHIAVVMSGNFVQRGDAAILSKWARAKQAMFSGADLVIELPLPWAVAGAEKFATGGVFLLNALGADVIGFGSECGDIDQLRSAAEALSSPLLGEAIRKELASGKTFASARQAAVESLFGAEIAAILREPNNILGIEYLKAAEKLHTKLTSWTIRREGAAHDSECPEGNTASARQIRSLLTEGRDCSGLMPKSAWEILSREAAEGRAPADLRYAERAVLAKLRCLTRAEYSDLPDLSEGLENRIFSALQKATTLSELYVLAKTKRYPLARIRRIVLAAFIGLKACHGAGLPPYLRVLGINGENGAQLLKQAAGKTDLPILTRSADFSVLKGTAKTIGDLENRSSDLYVLCMPKALPCGSDRTSGVVVL